ncbi:hypothetical protein CgunFtcFv8_022104 [Champsocephalus gunnari]|uniref:Uncharacterized protein n=1 Tax=Champsocephalus gunnari TaxID=52237 RepID=A0AAN8HSC1_CHAGU|nr:hypothetical protein CgunFtcFv8_022104 [Champsocephalus gunnari]
MTHRSSLQQRLNCRQKKTRPLVPPFPQFPLLPPSLDFHSELIPQLIPPSETTMACEHFKRTEILISHPSVAPKPWQVGWKIQTNNALMSGLDCLRSCDVTP